MKVKRSREPTGQAPRPHAAAERRADGACKRSDRLRHAVDQRTLLRHDDVVDLCMFSSAPHEPQETFSRQSTYHDIQAGERDDQTHVPQHDQRDQTGPEPCGPDAGKEREGWVHDDEDEGGQGVELGRADALMHQREAQQRHEHGGAGSHESGGDVAGKERQPRSSACAGDGEEGKQLVEQDGVGKEEPGASSAALQLRIHQDETHSELARHMIWTCRLR